MLDLDKDFNLIVAKIEEDIQKGIKQIALDTFNGIIEKSPVDTGYSRASWNISINEPDTTIPSKPSSGTLPAPKGDVPNLKGLPDIYITNALDYTLVLEAGRKEDSNGIMRGSIQAPYGMVSVTLAEIEEKYGV
jgi:hypothetical protein